MLEAEMEQHLGYAKHDYENKNTTNSRNSKSTKTMKSNLGLFDLDVPRDREGSFEPAIVRKHQTDVSHLESAVIGMYTKGITTRGIAAQINDIYGMDAIHFKVKKNLKSQERKHHISNKYKNNKKSSF
ncbi:transposase [Clostridium sp.]|uniref:transposase n=1 Tax=Clostridium sp. TaxID=1506 RepID=UPI002840FF05|nr:transposase [Clostridium sp.]MDR3596850.1 transposase [Clostridium sp.]